MQAGDCWGGGGFAVIKTQEHGLTIVNVFIRHSSEIVTIQSHNSKEIPDWFGISEKRAFYMPSVL